MARYDESRYGDESVEFAQETFSEARRWKEKQAKEEERFSRRLAIGETLVSGADFFINNAANNLENSQAFERASYQNMVTRTENFREMEITRQESGKSREEFYTLKLFDAYKEQFDNMWEGADSDTATNFLWEEAQKTAAENIDEFNQIMDLSQNVPVYKEGEFDEFYNSYNVVPRNVGELIAGKVRNVLSRETKETVAHKEAKARDAFYGTEMFEKFGDLRDSLKIFDATNTRMRPIFEDIKTRIAEGEILGDIIGEVQLVTDTYESKDGTMLYTDTSAHLYRKGLTGDFGPVDYEIVDYGITAITPVAGAYATDADIRGMLIHLTDQGRQYYWDAIENKTITGGRLTSADYQDVLSNTFSVDGNRVIDTDPFQGILNVAHDLWQADLGKNGYIVNPLTGTREAIWAYEQGNTSNDRFIKDDPRFLKYADENNLAQADWIRKVMANPEDFMRGMGRVGSTEDFKFNRQLIKNGFEGIFGQMHLPADDTLIELDWRNLSQQLRNLNPLESKFYEYYGRTIDKQRLQSGFDRRVILAQNTTGQGLKSIFERLGLTNMTESQDPHYIKLFSRSTEIEQLLFDYNSSSIYLKFKNRNP
jgi:hypothetical protein